MIFNKVNNAIGLVSEGIIFRTDLDVHNKGLKKADNCIIRNSGAIESFAKMVEQNYISYTNKPNIHIIEYRISEGDFANLSNKDSVKNAFLIAVEGKIDIGYLNNEGDLLVTSYISTDFTKEDVEGISYTQIDNTILMCFSTYKKPKMFRFREDVSIKFTFDEIDYWDNIKEGPLKSEAPQFYNKNNIKNTFCASWRRANGTTTEPSHGEIVLPEGYYLKINQTANYANGQCFTKTFLDKLLGGKIDIMGSQFKVVAYNDGTANITGSIAGSSVPPKFTGYLLVSLIPTHLSASTLIPTFENKVDANGNYVFISGTAIIDRQPYWETFDLFNLFYYVDLFKNNAYPALCSYISGRIVFSKIKLNENIVSFSRIFDYFSFSGNVSEGSSGFSVSIPSNEKTEIYDMVVHNSLMLFTDNGIYSLKPIDSITPLTTNFFLQQLAKPNKNFKKQYCMLGGYLYYIDFTNKLTMIYLNEYSTAYFSRNLTVYNEDIISSSIKRMQSFVYNGDGYIFMSKDDHIVLCRVDNQQKIYALTKILRECKSDLYIINNDLDYNIFEFYENEKISNVVKSSEYMDMEIEIYPEGTYSAKYEIPEIYNVEFFKLYEIAMNVKGICKILLNKIEIQKNNEQTDTVTFNNPSLGREQFKYTNNAIKFIGTGKKTMYNIQYKLKTK